MKNKDYLLALLGLVFGYHIFSAVLDSLFSNDFLSNLGGILFSGFCTGIVAGYSLRKPLLLIEAGQLGLANTIVANLLIGYLMGVNWTWLAIMAISILYSTIYTVCLLFGSIKGNAFYQTRNVKDL
jgi:hypothetical protein